MKKLFLLLTMGSIGLTANAQFVPRKANRVSPITKKTVNNIVPVAPTTAPHSAERTTAVAFYTHDFAGGIGTGWTTGVLAGPGTWHYTTVASTSAFASPALASTTAANGWMIFDSDSLGTACGSCSPSGYLQSELINCSTHPTVRLNFQESFRRFNDSCSVWVSTSPTFATYRDFPVVYNNNLTTNSSSPNPQTIHMNITSIAGGAAAVYIRFVYYGYAGGSYSWNVDDVNLSELDPHDVRIDKPFMFSGSGVYGSSIFATPLQFVDTVAPVTFLTNEGAGNESVAMNAQIFNGSTSVYNQSMTINPFNSGYQDSLIQFPGFVPTATGNYTVPMSATITTGDFDATNNVDTATFSVTDTTWMQNQGSFSTYYLRRLASGSTTAISLMMGARFDVPSTSAADTISGFGVAFGSSSVATGAGTVAVYLYSLGAGDASWTYLGTSSSRSLTSADYSTATSAVWAYFPINVVASGGFAPFIVAPNTTYAAVVSINNVNTQLTILATDAPNVTGYSGYFGQEDSSLNDGGPAEFGADLRTGLADIVPAVRLYFGHPSTTLGVSNVNAAAITTFANPNPASDEVKVAFNMPSSADVTVSLTNTLGQVVASQSVKATSNGSATFNTAALPAGVYIYSVNANGSRSTGRVVVAH